MHLADDVIICRFIGLLKNLLHAPMTSCKHASTNHSWLPLLNECSYLEEAMPVYSRLFEL